MQDSYQIAQTFMQDLMHGDGIIVQHTCLSVNYQTQKRMWQAAKEEALILGSRLYHDPNIGVYIVLLLGDHRWSKWLISYHCRKYLEVIII